MLRQLQSALLVSLTVPELLATAQEAYSYRETYGSGTESNVDAKTQDLITKANENPNATRSVTFKPFGSVILHEDDLGSLADVEWKWRINVTDFSAPNAEGAFVDPHVVNTVYDFSWPDGGNIHTALNNSGDAFCITNLGITGMPANVSNTITEDNKDSTDCAPVLGDACVNAITGTLSSLPGTGGCYSGSESFYSLPECASTLGYAYSQNPSHQAIIDTTNLNSANTSDGRLSSQAVWTAMTAASNGTNTSSYEAAVNQLQIMMISPVVNGTKPTPQLLCTRVNTTKLPETAANSSEGSGTDGNGTPNGENAGNTIGYQSRIGVAVALGWVSLVILCAM